MKNLRLYKMKKKLNLQSEFGTNIKKSIWFDLSLIL